MSDFISSSGVGPKMQVFAVSYKSRSIDDERWQHTHYQHLPQFDYYFQDTQYSPQLKTEHNTGTLNKNSSIVHRFNEKIREDGTSKLNVAEGFWDEQTRLEYERTLQRAVEQAITEVEREFNRRFVQYIEQQITQSDPLYSFVKNG